MERTADGKYAELNAQMAGWSYGRFDVPTGLIKSPEEKYRARVAKQENVDALLKSILQFGTVNEHVQVVLFVGANQAVPAKTGFKLPVTEDEMKARGFEGFFCIVGDHTQRAMNQLHSNFSKNPKWANLNAEVFVCRRTPEVLAALKSWGILDNIKGERRVTVSFQDKVFALHEDYLSLAEHASSPGHKERVAALKEQRRQDFGGVSSGQMMQLWSIAAREGKVWELLQKIISGEVVQPDARTPGKGRGRGLRKPAKAVNSAALFTNIGGVEDAVLVPLLHDVVIGHASLQRLNDQCALVKARMKLQTTILSDENVKLFDWDAAQKKFPLACHEDFVERWAKAVVREGIKARAAFPELFFQELDRRIKSDQQTEKRAGAAAAAVQVCININEGRVLRVVQEFHPGDVIVFRRCPKARGCSRCGCTIRR